jgi:chromosomal replication initiation ATPase DnaA
MKYEPTEKMKRKIEAVFTAVSEWYGIPLEQILGRRRDAHTAEARFVSIHLAGKIPMAAWPSIGWYANRHHLTCIYADKQVMEWKETDSNFAQRLIGATEAVDPLLKATDKPKKV